VISASGWRLRPCRKRLVPWPPRWRPDFRFFLPAGQPIPTKADYSRCQQLVLRVLLLPRFIKSAAGASPDPPAADVTSAHLLRRGRVESRCPGRLLAPSDWPRAWPGPTHCHSGQHDCPAQELEW
jgi:hypothetical protein